MSDKPSFQENIILEVDKKSFSDRAKQIVTEDRQTVYGHPYVDFTRIAGMWNAYLGVHETSMKSIEPEDVALMMTMVKMSRLRNTPTHEDSVVDIHGYANCYEMILDARKNEEMF